MSVIREEEAEGKQQTSIKKQSNGKRMMREVFACIHTFTEPFH